MINSHLLNAARYIEAVHDIPVDETDVQLEGIIQHFAENLQCTQVVKYWRDYQLEVNPLLAK